jgi:hypothetical protein
MSAADKILGVPSGYRCVVGCALGFRGAGDKYATSRRSATTRPKSSWPNRAGWTWESFCPKAWGRYERTTGRLKWRGLLYQSTDLEALDKRLSEGPVVCYCGFDPTSDSMHVGTLSLF